MRVVESTCHKIFLDGHRIISLLPSLSSRAAAASWACRRGGARNRFGVRVGVEQKVSPTLDIFRHSPDQWKDRFYSLQVAVFIVAEKRQSGAEYHELEFL